MKTNLHNGTDLSNFCSLEANWWLFSLRGALSIIFGGLMIFVPGPTILASTIFFGAYALMDGIFSISYGINRAYKHQQWGGLVLSGIASLLVGLIVLITPQIATISLMIFLWLMISIRYMVIGIFEIAAAIRLRKEITGEWLLALNGFFCFVLGVSGLILYWYNPLVSLLTLCLFIGFNSVTSGVILLILSFKLCRRNQKV